VTLTNTEKTLFWEKEVFREHPNGVGCTQVEIYRRKLELKREARPRIPVLRFIIEGMKHKVNTRDKHME
jgi:hypothetical protein